MSVDDDGFSSKNWVWIPDESDLFTKGYITDYLNDGKCKVTVVQGNKESTKVIESKLLENCNPTKFNKCNDMAELTHLNEPSVVYNLYLRYNDDMIYTYSGLFLVAINPYKSLPIYDEKTLKFFHTFDEKSDLAKPNTEGASEDRLPPHIFSIAEITFKNLLQNKKDQSILVTGESGAGKTENTKKIIQYLSSISKSTVTQTKGDSSIDEKILQANPILESFGNAKTIKNNNSSRFGKFIKIFFDPSGKINGANIDYYLLEKSRVIHQSKSERNYHIFYQFLKGYDKLNSLKLKSSFSDYAYLNNSGASIPNLNDKTEFNNLIESFNIIGLSDNDISNIFKVLAIILHLGNINFNNWKSEQASFTNDSPIDTIVEFMGIDKRAFTNGLIKPKVKAGREFVEKSKKPSEVKYSIDSLSKYLYETLFIFIIRKINDNLNNHVGSSDDNFIGVLDIAGFEIFDVNSFEQLCINYTNEKLQQFFNHHSFILEQSEYLREDIQWEFIDFGLDLQPTIDLIETKQPMGILKLLDEECIIPNSTDKTFLEKLFSHWGKDKHPKFKPNKFRSGFVVNHYAGSVEYNVDNWLNKNTDPVNIHILTLLSESSNEFIKSLFENDEHLLLLADESKKSKAKLKSSSSKHKDQLSILMEQLSNTEPHFVRCILPNLEKKPNKFDKQLVLNQLRCNGVLEGIRITRAGYPNKMTFNDFFSRYSILNLKEVFTKNNKTNSELILKHIALDSETFKVGITKIFFKNGILGKLEELRDLSMKSLFTNLQSCIRGSLARQSIQSKILRVQSGQVVARNFQRVGSSLKSNLWYSLFVQLKPLLEDSIKVLDTKEMNDNLKRVSLKLKDSEKINKNYETENQKLTKQLEDLGAEISSMKQDVSQKDSLLEDLKKKEVSSKSRIDDFESRLASLSSSKTSLENEKAELKVSLTELEKQFKELKERYDSLLKEHESFKTKSQEFESSHRELQTVKSDHSKAIEELATFKQKATDVQSEFVTLKTNHESSLNDKRDLESQLQKSEAGFKELKQQSDKLIADITKLKAEHSEKVVLLQSDLKKQKDSSSNNKEEVSKLNSQIKSLDSKNKELLQSLEKVNPQIDSLRSELKQAEKQLSEARSKSQKLEESTELSRKLKQELSEQKKNEDKHLKEIQSLTTRLSQVLEENKKHLSMRESIRVDLENTKLAKEQYSTRIMELQSTITKLEEQQREKENLPPPQDENLAKDYSNLKLKFNEANASLRREKFECKKLEEEIKVLKGKITISPYSSPNKNRRSLAMGEDLVAKNGNNVFMKQIEDLKLQLEQEEQNSQRAEGYAIELQKKLNKLQNTRGINSSLDFEKKYQEAQVRISELENKFGKFFESESPNSSKNFMSKSESFGRSSVISKTLANANQDFVKIYNDITKTLKTTREELTSSKSEILRLKSLLRESEDELYQIKRDTFKASISNYETELASLKVKQDNLVSRNTDLQSSLDLYKKRSDEYYQKLELAESAVSISKRHEQSAVKELSEVKNELRLAKEEAKAAHILVRDLRQESSKYQSVVKDNEFKIQSLMSQIKNLEERIAYNKKTYENRELNENYKEEIRSLHNDLNFKLENETKLVKENKQLQLDYETLLKQKEMLETDYEDKLDKVDSLESQVDDYSKKLRVLDNEKVIHERKIVNLSKQITGLKDLISEISEQRDKLLEAKDDLEERNLILSQELEEATLQVESKEKDMSVMREHLESQRQESSDIQNELNQSKMSNNDDITSYQKLKRENLVLSEENDTLVRVNKELKAKSSSLEQKLYDNEQIKYWETKVREMNLNLDTAKAENYDLNKQIHSFKTEIRKYEIKNVNDSKLIKKYNDENFDFQNKVNHFKSTIDILHNENLEKDLQIKTFERESTETRETMLRLEKEVLELRSKLGVA